MYYRIKLLNMLFVILIISSSVFFIFFNILALLFYKEVNHYFNLQGDFPYKISEILSNDVTTIIYYLFSILILVAFVIYIINSELNEHKKGFYYVTIPSILLSIYFIIREAILVINRVDESILYFYSQLSRFFALFAIITFLWQAFDLKEKLSKVLLILGSIIAFIISIFGYFNDMVLFFDATYYFVGDIEAISTSLNIRITLQYLEILTYVLFIIGGIIISFRIDRND